MSKKEKFKKMDLTKLMGEEAKDLDRVLMPAIKHIKEKQKRKEGIEAFLMSWSLIEQIVLPSFIRILSKKLHLKNVPDLNKFTTKQLITCYYFLSHDQELYEKLCIANSKRNKLIHRLYKDEVDFELINKDALKFAEYILKKVLIDVIEKIFGNPPVPVLTLYGTGWNDAISQCIKSIKEDT
jgi:hypothetical protein